MYQQPQTLGEMIQMQIIALTNMIVNQYILAIQTTMDIVTIYKLISLNLLAALLSVVVVWKILIYTKGRHRKDVETQGSTTANTVLYVNNNVLNSRGETRGHYMPQIPSIKKYPEGVKINVWLARLQIYLQDYVDPSNWVSHTLMLINSQMTEKLGDLKF
jgi:hypothetical protein